MNYNEEYKVYYYRNSHTKRVPVLEYIQAVPTKDRGKIAAYITFLRDQSGRLDEPYGRYIRSGIRELRIEFANNRHRIFYITIQGKKIILLHAFLKKTPKTPKQEIIRALNNFEDYKINKNLIEYGKET
ncbi:MAG: type II toxin-antitoxin system RelE/ParE family toxin [Candidatus Nealsonbacteria bacterium CG_4_9_14_0_2_um_filter_37_38]|uniref:Type II toxin-antitoxin system RelE/ParE family toxin n=1 Tax=Candidatus Nealsonbacteria bacterium CG_4_10_14_0_8_um_filter_37_14 TaxID=1974684 RepID=A0A2M7R6T6_9BACT|nr:MAG: addiction module toxin RelE [Candidatus Nealsonbacteria bacterium CG11_big_fil_rev_8_21_14_0_20_37_68]PIY88936.1 MAG: type II toxin-antitoxin system RelE/ParE family toxin [Candidatus Nealsonbacteria bacterium CG_4_10_14_0_8_um_filter_37_14]PJC51592.1 MAG: type II toxin-antitoxin system RelE/ParE family toxin [Candidatus Nealsonbacteria bacterium CG_4_9_14_0_2_um_filter_37_38]